MAILGISNRTENWKTARHFAPLLLDGSARVELARKLGEDYGTSRGDVDLELFWKGMRDYKHQTGMDDKTLLDKSARYYGRSQFHNLRGRIEEFNKNNPSRTGMTAKKYELSDSGDKKGLLANLLNTEIDIVLETPGQLFIGEAKEEAALGADGNYVLVHQLIRQFVMAKTLLHLMGKEKKGVVPFLVVEDDRYGTTLNTSQVKFMISQEWLQEANVLTWAYIERLRS